jgi:hypothetical protein
MFFACSGGGESIGRNIEIGYSHAGFAGALLAFSLALHLIGPRNWAALASLALILAIHPAWTVSAIHGDCGYLKRDASICVTFVCSVVFAWQLVRAVFVWLSPRTVDDFDDRLRDPFEIENGIKASKAQHR